MQGLYHQQYVQSVLAARSYVLSRRGFRAILGLEESRPRLRFLGVVGKNADP